MEQVVCTNSTIDQRVDEILTKQAVFDEIPLIQSFTYLRNQKAEIIFLETNQEKQTIFSRIFHGILKGECVALQSPSLKSAQTLLVSYSPSRELKAIFLRKERIQIEIWKEEQLENVIDFQNTIPTETAEQLATNQYFGSVKWSKDEKFILFTTFENRQIGSTLYAKDNQKKPGEFKERYRFDENWGNQLENTEKTSIWIGKVEKAAMNSHQIKKIPIDDALFCGQAVFAPNNRGIVFSATKAYHRKLGIGSCVNRAAGIYFLPLEIEKYFNEWQTYELGQHQRNLRPITTNSEEDFGAVYPTFSPDGKYIIYLSFASVSAHNSCNRVRRISWDLETHQPLPNSR